jgi:hypothetical protein
VLTIRVTIPGKILLFCHDCWQPGLCAGTEARMR